MNDMLLLLSMSILTPNSFGPPIFGTGVPDQLYSFFKEPENAAVTAHIERAKAQRKAGQATIPSTLAEECQSNPFLRWDSPEIQSVLAMQGANPSAILGELRARKDAF